MREKLIAAFGGLLDSTIQAAPKVAVGILLVIAGLVFTKLIEIALRTVLRRAHFDDLIKKMGGDEVLHHLGIRQQLSEFLPRCAYYLVLCILAQTTAEAFGLVAISNAIASFFAYLPNVIAAILLLAAGSALGQFVGQTVTQAAQDAGLDMAPALGRVVSGGIFFVCAMMAVSQLQIDTGIVRIVTSIILGGAALAFGLSFGFGTREVVRNITAGFYARKILEVGKALEIRGERGTLKSITATHVILESEGREISIANSAVLSHITKQ